MKTGVYTIRTIQEADQLPVLAMQAKSWLDTYPNPEKGVSKEWVEARTKQWMTDENLKKRREFIRASNKGDSLYIVAENEKGVIVGLGICRNEAGKYRLGALYVDVAHHGSGVAHRLMEKLLSWAGPATIELEVVSYNERAKAFYRKYGFREVEGSDHILHEILPVITMVREGEKG
ncbi:MAG TPA: GNAT family N-acetyltransferase [Candidatus Saccharimonadales bacterium]|nr:GNAT family N-acetyltransferase [Candidatus Saccharimonadales bacterium]